MKKILMILCTVALLFSCTKKDETEAEGKTERASVPAAFGAPIQFSSVDLNGNVVTNAVFGNADVTMVNVWATWCGPCCRELPEIGKIARKYEAQGYQVLGFIQDCTVDDDATVAREILAEAQCEYPVVLNDPSLSGVYSSVAAFPTTLFIDKSGNLIGSEYAGAMTEAAFDEAFQKAIKEVKAAESEVPSIEAPGSTDTADK